MFLKKGGISRRGDGKRKEGPIILSALCSRFSMKSVIKHCLESAKQNITKTELIMNASNIPYYFEQLLLLTYICTYSIISNTKSTIVTPNILLCKIRPFVLIILLLFHSILTSSARSNTRVAMGMTPNYSARYELTFCISFYLLNN